MATQALRLGNDYISAFTQQKCHRSSCGSMSGRVFREIGEGISDGAKGVFEGARKVVMAFGQVRCNASAFSRALGLSVNAFSAMGMAFGTAGAYAAAAKRFVVTRNIIDTVQVLGPVSYFGQGKYRAESIYNSLSNAAFLFAGTLGVVNLLSEVSLVNLAKVSDAFGKIPVLGQAAGFVSLGSVITGAVGIGFAFLGADAIKRIVTEEERAEKARGWVDLAWSVSEVALSVFMLSGCTSVPGMLILGSTALTLGISSYLYGVYQPVSKTAK